MRLYLPSRIDFFARHRLAAAVVGIVAATGISFTMARWLVFRPPIGWRESQVDRAVRPVSRDVVRHERQDQASAGFARDLPRNGTGRDQGDRRDDRRAHPQVGPVERVDDRETQMARGAATRGQAQTAG